MEPTHMRLCFDLPHRRTSVLALLLVAIATTVVSAGTLTAQSAQRWSVQGSLLSVVPSGDAYEGLASGIGLEAQLRYTPSAFSLGIGYQLSSHDLTFFDGSTVSVTVAGIFAEPRFVIDVGSATYAPYLAARVALLTQELEFDGLQASASGTQFNVGGGLLFRLTPRVNLDLGATYGAINFDDVTVSFEGQTATVEGSSGSGRNLVLRIGFTIGLR